MEASSVMLFSERKDIFQESRHHIMICQDLQKHLLTDTELRTRVRGMDKAMMLLISVTSVLYGHDKLTTFVVVDLVVSAQSAFSSTEQAARHYELVIDEIL